MILTVIRIVVKRITMNTRTYRFTPIMMLTLIGALSCAPEFPVHCISESHADGYYGYYGNGHRDENREREDRERDRRGRAYYSPYYNPYGSYGMYPPSVPYIPYIQPGEDEGDDE